MDFNKEYAAHQRALMRADGAVCIADRKAHLATASSIADRIGKTQRELGAAAACAWTGGSLRSAIENAGVVFKAA